MSSDTTVTQAVGFTDIRQQLQVVADENKALIFDYESAEGNKAARSQIYRLKRYNGEIDKTHKVIKADVLKQSQMIDAAKRELKQMVSEMIAVHQTPLDQIAKRERDRVDAIDVAMRALAAMSHVRNPTHATAVKRLDELLELQIDKSVFQERFDEADEVLADAIDQVQQMAARLKEQEAKDRELEVLRKEKAERERIAREQERDAPIVGSPQSVAPTTSDTTPTACPFEMHLRRVIANRLLEWCTAPDDLRPARALVEADHIIALVRDHDASHKPKGA